MDVIAIRTGAAPPGWREVLAATADRTGCPMLLLPADSVKGRLHAVSAVEHAERAFSRGENRARTREVEALLYLLGERQASAALEQAAPGADNVLIAWGERAGEAATRALERLGPSRGPLEDLVAGTLEALERTALLDLDR